MKFRIVYIGNTHQIDELKAAAQEINPTARSQWLGICLPDDAIEAEVESVEEGKKLMAHIYKKVNCFPKRYSFVDGPEWWSNDRKTFLGTTVCSDRYDYATPVTEEHFEDFLEA